MNHLLRGLAPISDAAWSEIDSEAKRTLTHFYAARKLVPASVAVKVPEGVSLDTAAATMLQGITAHYLVASTFEVKPGHDVLVHAAAGGVGLLLVQLAKARGARVIGTVSTEEKEKLAREAGAAGVDLNTGETDTAARALYESAGFSNREGAPDGPSMLFYELEL